MTMIFNQAIYENEIRNAVNALHKTIDQCYIHSCGWEIDAAAVLEDDPEESHESSKKQVACIKAAEYILSIINKIELEHNTIEW